MKKNHDSNLGKNSKKIFFMWFIPALLIFAAGFTIGAFYDLSINKALYQPENAFAITWEATCKYPICLSTIMLSALWIGEKGRPLIQKIGAGLVTAGILAYMFYDTYEIFVKRDWFKSAGFVVSYICFCICILGIFFFAVHQSGNISTKLRSMLTFVGIWGTVYMLADLAFVGGGKIIWQRTRFDDMFAIGNFDNFTPWYKPFANGGSSFPSGHTAAACGIFMLIVLCDVFPKMNKYRKSFYLICWLYISVAAVSRVIIGRHYMTDTLAAAAGMSIMFFIMRRTPFYKKSLAKLKDGGAAGEEPQ